MVKKGTFPNNPGKGNLILLDLAIVLSSREKYSLGLLRIGGITPLVCIALSSQCARAPLTPSPGKGKSPL